MTKYILIAVGIVILGVYSFYTKANPEPDPGNLQEYLHVSASGVTEYILINPKGKKLGYNPITEENFNSMLGGYEYGSSGRSKEIYSPEIDEGTYTIQVFGIANGEYNLEVGILKNMGMYRDSIIGTTSPNQIDTYKFTLDSTKTDNIEIQKIPAN